MVDPSALHTRLLAIRSNVSDTLELALTAGVSRQQVAECVALLTAVDETLAMLKPPQSPSMCHRLH